MRSHLRRKIRDELAAKIGSVRARGVVIDVTALDVLDSFATRTLRGIAHTAKLRGAETVVVGIQPDVAFGMIQLGLGLEDVETAGRAMGQRLGRLAGEQESGDAERPSTSRWAPAKSRADARGQSARLL